MIIVVGIGTFFSIVFHIGVKEAPETPYGSEESSIAENGTHQKGQEQQQPSTVSWKGWLREVHFYQVIEEPSIDYTQRNELIKTTKCVLLSIFLVF